MQLGNKIKFLREQLDLTQEDLAKKLNVATQTIHKYEAGIVTNIPLDKIKTLANILKVSPSYLCGWQANPQESEDIDIFKIKDIKPIATKKIPMLGEIACGQPIYAEEQRGYYVEIGTDINADFCLTARGDSMIGARIYDGDIVFCKSQPTVNNGEIAVVLIDDEVTLKKVFFYPDKQKLVLQPENSNYEPFVYIGEELREVRIIGKAIAFHSDIRYK